MKVIVSLGNRLDTLFGSMLYHKTLHQTIKKENHFKADYKSAFSRLNALCNQLIFLIDLTFSAISVERRNIYFCIFSFLFKQRKQCLY